MFCEQRWKGEMRKCPYGPFEDADLELLDAEYVIHCRPLPRLCAF